MGLCDKSALLLWLSESSGRRVFDPLHGGNGKVDGGTKDTTNGPASCSISRRIGGFPSFSSRAMRSG